MNLLSKYKYWIAGAFCLFVIGLVIGAVHPKHVSGARPAGPPEVQVAPVEQKDVQIYVEHIGTLDGFENADVRAQVTGYLMRQDYQEGALVKKGQLLFEIDPRPFQAALDQAKGQRHCRSQRSWLRQKIFQPALQAGWLLPLGGMRSLANC